MLEVIHLISLPYLLFLSSPSSLPPLSPILASFSPSPPSVPHSLLPSLPHPHIYPSPPFLPPSQDWSNLDQLLVKSRAARLQGLQSLTEMQEYLSLMASSGNIISRQYPLS